MVEAFVQPGMDDEKRRDGQARPLAHPWGLAGGQPQQSCDQGNVEQYKDC